MKKCFCLCFAGGGKGESEKSGRERQSYVCLRGGRTILTCDFLRVRFFSTRSEYEVSSFLFYHVAITIQQKWERIEKGRTVRQENTFFSILSRVCSSFLVFLKWSMEVSNQGRMRSLKVRPHHGTIRDGYRRISHNKKSYSLHVLIAKTFLGPRPSVDHTVDHINMDKSDNRVQNLRWATNSEQVRGSYSLNMNRKSSVDKVGVRIEARSRDGEWIPYESINDAARVLSVSKGNIYTCLKGRRTHTKGFQFRRIESQIAPLEGEKWRPIYGIHVSSLGRVRTQRGHVHFGSRSADRTYASVNIKNKNKYVHVLVARAFHGNPPTSGHSVDHINNDTTDNRACNLRWATHSEQVLHSYTSNLQRGTHVAKLSFPIRGCLTGTSDWRTYDSINDATRRTGYGSVIRALRNPSRNRKWTFEYLLEEALPGEEWKAVHPDDLS